MIARARAIGRDALSAFVLAATWWIACEALRERAPALFVIFLLTLWPALIAATLVVRGPASPRENPGIVGATLALALLALDGLVDAWIPYQPRFLHAPWEALRMVPVVLLPAAVAARREIPRGVLLAAHAARYAALGLVCLVALGAAQIVAQARRDDPRRADAALVLGFALDPSGRPKPSLIARVDHAVALYRAGRVHHLVFTGGRVIGPVSEASVMRELALARGVPDAAILLESESHSTVENFENSRPLLLAHGFYAVTLVTEPYHMARALLLAPRDGVVAYASPAPSPAWSNPREATYWLFRDAIFFIAETARDPFVPRRLAAH